MGKEEHNFFIIMLIAIVVMLACVHPVLAQRSVPQPFVGTVYDVQGGDTIFVYRGTMPERRTEFLRESMFRVKLAHITSPYRGQMHFMDSKRFLEMNVVGKEVKVYPFGYNDDHLLAADVAMEEDGVYLNEAVLTYGYAWLSPGVESDRLVAAQLYAQDNRSGLWSRSNPQPPWEWKEMRPYTIVRKMQEQGMLDIGKMEEMQREFPQQTP